MLNVSPVVSVYRLIGVGLAFLLSQVCSVSLSGAEPSLSGTGTVQIERPAERMRIVIPLTDQGEDVRRAVEALNEKIDAARVQLATLGAIQDSVRVTPAGIDQGTSDAHRQMLMRMRAAMSGEVGEVDDDESETEDGETMISVRTRVTAEWTLPKDDPVALLEAAWSIENSVREAELNGGDQDGETDESEEMLEEAMMFGDRDGENSDDISITFLARIDRQERARLMKEAFAKARLEAEELAAAGGTTLGRLKSVSSSADDDSYAMMQQAWGMSSGDDTSGAVLPDEVGLTAAGKEPGRLVYSVTVHAGFDFAE